VSDDARRDHLDEEGAPIGCRRYGSAAWTGLSHRGCWLLVVIDADSGPAGQGDAAWRSVASCFTLDVGADGEARLRRWSGASRFAYNALLGEVKAGLDARSAERTATDVARTRVPWSRHDLIRAATRLRRQLTWGAEIPAAVFECAGVNLASGLANWAASRAGRRRGKTVGFPRFHTKRQTTPRCRLRHPEQLRVEGRRVRCRVWAGCACMKTPDGYVVSSPRDGSRRSRRRSPTAAAVGSWRSTAAPRPFTRSIAASTAPKFRWASISVCGTWPPSPMQRANCSRCERGWKHFNSRGDGYGGPIEPGREPNPARRAAGR
jgi:hypothetical protein